MLIVIVALVVVGTFDMAANWGKAYGNVTVNGVAVGGMTADEMRDTLKSTFSSRVSHAQITIYADEESKARAARGESAAVDSSIAEQLSVEEAYAMVDSWTVDALAMKANVPYDKAVEAALAVGRSDGGILARLALFGGAKDVPLSVEFDEETIENLASQIDLTIGDPHTDATVYIEDGVASAVEGRDGTMVDRDWLANMISRAMIEGDVPGSFVAETVQAQSRISAEQAESMARSINHAIGEGALFSYQGKTWLAGPVALGDWTQVTVEGEEGSWHLQPSIISSSAIPVVVDKMGTEITADDVAVTFERTGSGVVVHTAGEANIPEVPLAVSELERTLYGEGGIAWKEGTSSAPTIEIIESDRPETLSFDDAVDLGLVTVVGEYTTEFSNVEGTENRNHNIKLAADRISDGIVDGQGGIWSFNDREGDANEEAGFWTAGSIIDGEIVDSVGGGVCQVATTVFNAVLEAGLDIVERHNHTLFISGYPDGRDAAVDYPTQLDFVWKNTLDSDVLLKMSYTDTSITAQIYSVYTGLKSKYDVGDWEKGKKYTTVFKLDESIGDGAYYLKTKGEDGKKIKVTRTVTNSSDTVVKVDSFESVYDAKDEMYVIGNNVDKDKLKKSREDASNDGESDDDEPNDDDETSS